MEAGTVGLLSQYEPIFSGAALKGSIPEAVRFLLQGQRLQGFRSVYRHKAVRKFIVIAMAVQTSEPTDHQTFLHTTFLFADAWTGVSIAEYPLANRTKMGVLTALNKKHQNPP